MKNVSAICGGAGGIGRATAIELGKNSTIIIGDLVQENIDYTDKILTSLNIEHYNMVMDVRDRKSVYEFAEFAAQHGKISEFHQHCRRRTKHNLHRMQNFPPAGKPIILTA